MTRTKFVDVGVAARTTVTVARSSANGDRPQGLVLDADHPLRAGDVEARRIVLWSTSAPEHVDVFVSEAGDLRIWHVWRDGDLIQAWEGEAGIEVDDDGDDLGLRCTDGHPDSEVDLEVRLRFDRAWTQPSRPDA